MNMSKILTSIALALTLTACASPFQTKGHPELDCPEGQTSRPDVTSHNFCVYTNNA